MTSPALVVLTLALVCSTYGTAMGQTADQASEHEVHNPGFIGSFVDSIPHTERRSTMAPTMRPRTNSYNYIVNSHIKNSGNRKEHDNNNIYYQKDISKVATNLDNVDNIELRSNVNIFPETLDELPHEYSNFYKRREANLENNFVQLDKGAESEEIRQLYINSNQISLNDKKPEQPVVIETRYIHFGRGGVRHFVPDIIPEHDSRILNNESTLKKRRVKREDKYDPRCEAFMDNKIITHPHNATFPSKTYYGQIDCVHVIEAKENKVIRLTFIDVFHIEEHPKCAHDYLEIRNGQYGFSKLMGKFCGTVFPPTLTSTGPFMWLKFKSDDTIEYEGFTIKVEFISSTDSYRIPSECYMQLKDKPSGLVDITQVDPVCIQKSKEGNHGIDLLFNITTAENTDINLNFTQFDLSMPNECEENIVEVYGYIMEEDKNLDRFCGSAANALSTRPEGKPNPANRGNVMYVHIYMSQKAYEATKINATYTAFRTLDPMKDEKCDESTEFNCDDNTCIAFALKCDRHAHCRLKTDEDAELCKNVQESLIQQPHIMVILVIFSLILSGMSFVFLFKCIRKLYQDHKAIKEHIRQSTEENLDSLMGVGEQILNPGLLTRELRASLERENHANEYKRGLSRHKIPQQTSIESDFEESPLDQDDRPWRTEVGVVPEPLEKKVERNGRTRRSDVSKKEESVRKVSVEEKKEIRDAAVGAPDTKESGCQTRESLFETATAPSSDGSNSASNSRGFSTFGYSGATLARPSPPTPAPAPMISSTQIELLRQLPSLDGSYTSSKSRKKLPDRRPMSAETTRSAPDVIIVSKPIR